MHRKPLFIQPVTSTIPAPSKRRFAAATTLLLLATPCWAATLYVDLNNLTPRPPYSNWDTAATNIQDAVDAAATGDEILVTNGLYATGGRAMYGTMTNRVAIDRAVMVRSVNGPLVTAIGGGAAAGTTNGDGAVRCVYLGTNAMLSGFTLTNGHTRAAGDSAKEQSGGGVWSEPSGVVSNCNLNGNSSYGSGGGAYSGILDNCSLIGNLASLGPGGGANNSRLNNCALSGNSVFGRNGGGGATCNGTLSNCTLSANSAWVGGGTCYGTLNNCSLNDNRASDSGGGTYFGTLNNCTLTGNSAGNYGGGTYNATLMNCTLTGNSSSNGGAAYAAGLANCTVNGNSANYGGGVSYSALTNCTLNANSAYLYGGGAYRGGMNNCTLNGNLALAAGGGTYSNVVFNCIVFYNWAPDGSNDYSSRFAYSCTTPLPPGPGNFDSEPLLASISHLSAQSPCIGRGSSAYSAGVDIDGESWLDPPCIGADQFVASQASGMLSVEIARGATNLCTGFPVGFEARISGRLTASVWEFGDGIVVSNRPYMSHAWATPGLYELRLTGYNDSWPSGISAMLLVQVGNREVYYVNGSNEAPRYPYPIWEDAATNIQDAIDAGTQVGRLVLVADGVYGTGGRAVYGQMTNRVVMTEGVELRSVNGPSATRIEGGAVPGTTNGDGAIRCVYVGTNAVLSGFTLTNGHTRTAGDSNNERRGGGAWCELSAVVTNCVLISNSAHDGAGAYSGTLNNCVLSGNSASCGGGSRDATLNNCALTGNFAFTGGGAYSGTLNNCTVTGNRGSPIAGGVYNSKLNNCIVYYNTASMSPNCGSVEVVGSCTTPLPPGPGNITNAPLFVNTNDWGNLRLQPSSPCINGGNNAYAPGPIDLDGRPRISGGTVDMGAYEFQSPASSISYAWLAQYGLPTDGSADHADLDLDGMDNWQEWVAGTNPTNSASVLRMLSATDAVSGVAVSWSSVTNRFYALERATNLGSPGPFSVLQSNLAGHAVSTGWTDTNALEKAPRFYRVRVQN